MNKIINGKNTAKIIINSKYGEFEILIDSEDIKKIENYNFHISIRHGCKYARTNIPLKLKESNQIQTTTYIHNIIMGKKYVDHIDGNPLNNKKSNLRTARTINSFRKMNAQNAKPRIDNILGLRGIRIRNYNFIINATAGSRRLTMITTDAKKAIHTLEHWRIKYMIGYVPLKLKYLSNAIKFLSAQRELLLMQRKDRAKSNLVY